MRGANTDNKNLGGGLRQTGSGSPQTPETNNKNKMSNTVYVVVLVSYDYYRFQDNLAATTDRKSAIEIAQREAHKRQYGSGNLLIIEDAETSSNMNDSEIPHILIEEFSQNEGATK